MIKSNSSGSKDFEGLFDPDMLRLDKKMIYRVFDAIEKRWSRNTTSKLKNAQIIASVAMAKGWVRITPQDTISDLWMDIINGVNELIMLNQMYRLRGEFPNTEKLVEMVCQKLESGQLFSALRD